ncbi:MULTISPECIES: metal-dependent hydrolase family protein [Glycomyces]|uniref:Amidohydrolase family protein n=2 Tax=Glycomyces TaxID=58113 RepID=A0A9X3PFP4_9ACTN|nr:amidohydrolase family protein [Glycomyces lechevalierae]MDA1384117.1 amidohydrolase family protein [Glycomyces lechevalierae]MDR7339454.1 imidazolonepropionase-like amidohydrolase [Glycomyces lechevalierae]
MTEGSTFFTNAAVLDTAAGEITRGQRVLVRGNEIAAVGPDLETPGDARVLDLAGKTLMPGLIDCHAHVNAHTANLAGLADESPAYVALKAANEMREMLHRGFTTVRDPGGADFGLHEALAEGVIEGPRLYFGGKALSQTGGHGDGRPRGRAVREDHQCCPDLSTVCDGVDEVRRAAREQLRTGAHHVKIMLSGGVASPTDRIDSTQFSIEEIRAIVEEAEAANRYVAGHAYTARAINRGLAAGVRSIEHGNLLDESSVELFLEHDAFLVPTLVTYERMAVEGADYGLPAASREKNPIVLEAGLRALEIAHRAGVNICYGSDLLGGMRRHQLQEFAIRGAVIPAADVIRSATVTAARLLGESGRLGQIVPGALADLLVIDGDPLADLAALTDPDTHLKLIMQGGNVKADRLAAA